MSDRATDTIPASDRSFTGPLERVDDCCYRIPKAYKPGMLVDGLISEPTAFNFTRNPAVLRERIQRFKSNPALLRRPNPIQAK
jgi:hypothetical protein